MEDRVNGGGERRLNSHATRKKPTTKDVDDDEED
jgi:hypothetical protein